MKSFTAKLSLAVRGLVMEGSKLLIEQTVAFYATRE